MAVQSVDGVRGVSGAGGKMNCKFESLQKAVEDGNVALVKELLRAGADLEAPNKDGNRPLHLAILHKQDEVLEVLIAHKCDVNSVVMGNRALCWTIASLSAMGLAAECDNVTAVKALIRAGADMNAADAEASPLQVCASLNRTEIAAILLDNGAQVDEINKYLSALHQAVINRHTEMADFLLCRGAAVSIQETYLGLAPLQIAVMNCDLSMVELLVRHGADVNAMVGCVDTPLSICITRNSPEILEFLLANGARVNDFDVISHPINLIVARSNSVQLLKILLKNGPILNERTILSETALLGITSETDKEVIQILLDHNVKFNLADKYRLYPVHYAALSGNVDAVQLLIDRGVSVDCCGFNNWTPLHLAAGYRRGRLVQVLLEKGADVNKTDTFGRTVLEFSLTGLPTFPRSTVWRDIHTRTVHMMEHYGLKPNVKEPNVTSSNADTMDVITLATILIRNGAVINLTNFGHLHKLGDVVLNGQSLPTSYLKAYIDLFHGIAKNQLSVVKACLKGGAFVDCVTNLGTPLTYACKVGSSDITEALLASGADPNVKAGKGMTPLHFAAFNGEESLVISLLCKGAMYNAQNTSRRKPIFYAKKSKNDFITNLLTTVESLFRSARIGDLGILSSLTILKNMYASKRSALGIDNSKCINQLNFFFAIKDSSGKNLAQVAQANNNSMFVHYMWDALQIK